MTKKLFYRCNLLVLHALLLATFVCITVTDLHAADRLNGIAGVVSERDRQTAAASIASESSLASSVKVTGFRFNGNQSIPSSDLQKFLAGYVNSYCDLSRLRDAADSLSKEYARRGLNFAKAYVPAQNIKDGIVEIVIVEGKLGEIKVEGNNNYSSDFIRSFLAAASSNGPVTSEKLESGLLILNSEFTDLKVSAELVPSKEPGAVGLRVSAKDSSPLHLTVSINNYGNDSVSRYRYMANVDWTNALIPGALLTVGGLVGDKVDHMASGNGSYVVPVNSLGTKLGIRGMYGNSTVSKEFAELGIETKEASTALSIKHPFYKSRTLNISGELGFRSTDSRFYLMDQLSSHDKVRVVYAELQGDSVLWNGKNFLNLNLSQGLSSFLNGTRENDSYASRAGADNGFTRAALHYARQQYLNDYFSAFVRLGGQWSSDSLLAGEEWQVGGVDSVRGYAPGEASGDDGYRASVELRMAPLTNKEILQVGTFVDYGSSSRKTVVVGQDKSKNLTGAGFGVYSHFNLFVPADLRVDVGWPLNPSENFLDEKPVIYFSLSSRF